MISKSLVHSVVTFCNNYIGNKYITHSISIFPKHIACNISIWKLDLSGYIDTCIHTYYGHIEDIDDFINFKRKVLETIDNYINDVTNQIQ